MITCPSFPKLSISALKEMDTRTAGQGPETIHFGFKRKNETRVGPKPEYLSFPDLSLALPFPAINYIFDLIYSGERQRTIN